MIYWLKSFISLLIALSTLIVADDPCRFEHSKGIIDLTSLGRTDGKPAYPDQTPSVGSNYVYSYNPCKPFSEGDTCKGVAACQVSKDRTLTFILAKQDSAEWDAGAGTGANPSIWYTLGTKRVSVELVCATDESNQLEVLGEGPINTYKFRLTNKCACWNGCGGVPPPPPPPPPQQNCTINGSTYSSDREIIQSFPFTILINPPQPQSAPPTSSYVTVGIYSRVIELILVNIPSIPPALFCLNAMEKLSIFNSPNVVISSEISRLSLSLKSLIVSNISRSGPLPAEIFNMKNLSTLSIINCDLEMLSEDVSKLNSLTQLTLDRNRLLSLPWALGKLPSLTSLSVNNNLRLSSLDVLYGSTSLNILQASNCMINHLPANIPNLRIIELDGNQLTSLDGFETIASQNSTLFSFNNNKIASISSVSLAKIVVVNDFYLSNNLLTTLPDSLYLIKDLKKVNIQNNNFNAKEKDWIQGVFRITNTTLII
ncbi:unnamed protein product [Adineta steineri]|uniref:L domain-like protein n=1 Tax=Adineta steineri TaxID=433720 RepID=A0A819PPA6_9BILA|nr:unnamed protein product [Adineta steineri]CAF4012459.1 unnamed protein product [Adineta steineri]